MIRVLMKSIREFKRASILAPVLVSLEVIMECIMPFVVAQLVNQIKAIVCLQSSLEPVKADFYLGDHKCP